MGKKKDVLDLLAELTHPELLEIETAVRASKKKFKPFRIKRKFKRCGKPDCFCMDGPADNSWENLHGPYLFAQWREGGKTRTASLGREYSSDEISEAGNGLPNWYDFIISQKQYDGMSQDRQWECYERSLENDEFEAHYGIAPMDDNIGRARKLRYDSRAYKTAYDEAEQANKVKWSDWAKLGVGTFSGIQILDDLVKRGYYFKE
jgi:hypothetical protein